MAQPPPYNRQASFANLQALNPTGQPPGNTMDAEFNGVKTTLDATLADLALIQNDDGTVANASIGPAQLAPQLVLGFNPPMAWVTAHAYTASPASTVLQGTGIYLCLVSHTSAVFASDLAAGKWLLIFDLSALTFGNASQIAVSAHGTNVTANVQTSLNNLEDNKAALSHTHTSAQISDSTAAGRAMLTAATATAQQALLGLGSLAFLNSLSISNIPAQLAFTGAVTPASLGTDQNDYTPTGWAALSTLLQASSTTVNITGFGATTDGDLKFVENIGASNIVLVGNSVLSAAGSRILIAAPLTLHPSQGVTMRYSTSALGWTVLTPMRAAPPRWGSRNLRMGNVANVLGDAAPVAPNNQVYLNADQVILEDANGQTWRTAVAAIVDGTVQNQVNGTDAALSISTNTWYAIWVIGNPSTRVVGGLISGEAVSPALPAGFTFKALAGWMRTDGSSHFLKALQMGRRARYSGTLPTITSGNNVGGAVSVANFVPTTAIGIAVVPFGDIAAGTSMAVSPSSTTSPSTVNISNTTGAGHLQGMGVSDLLLEASTLFYTSSAGAGPGIVCAGWFYAE